ncbi:hypothetical protein TWF225_009758 [Orbilia oligospora]|uniref:Uncharacterized protein n=2 Tax=Orbilia oligospora TaxID=2813651 RepID=A0A7C8PKN9_ORBOL|nr:hypothetical protein TWF751_006597 [Orbilia oligospora]KAF3173482.1 hypothetical protein TWF225_009758 [Orbilia oligospora]KAF3239580.1 hypothetical protein TWF217_001248 [Orbilia oligospora]KAF3261223.1 hypothetical protein TWF128_003017 [Orbilia oligospora]TGJ62328.1 hypothetical protein EYR41_002307 [Orbilia oligospora]
MSAHSKSSTSAPSPPYPSFIAASTSKARDRTPTVSVTKFWHLALLHPFGAWYGLKHLA